MDTEILKQRIKEQVKKQITEKCKPAKPPINESLKGSVISKLAGASTAAIGLLSSGMLFVSGNALAGALVAMTTVVAAPNVVSMVKKSVETKQLIKLEKGLELNIKARDKLLQNTDDFDSTGFDKLTKDQQAIGEKLYKHITSSNDVFGNLPKTVMDKYMELVQAARDGKITDMREYAKKMIKI